MAYMLLMLPLGTIYFTIAVTGLSVAVAMITSPVWVWAVGWTFVNEAGVTYASWPPLWATPLTLVGGVIVFIVWLHIVRWIGRGHAAFAKAMLVRLAK
jgi:hypothetical protein